MNSIVFNILTCSLLLSIFLPLEKKQPITNSVNWNKVSEEFLLNSKKGENSAEIKTQLYNATLKDLNDFLDSDEKKLSFWINIYNAYIQDILSEHPEKYQDRSTFFKTEQIPIAGRMVSFEKIEHGIIRKSQWSLGLGLVRKWFPDKFERKLRVDKRDFRIHFALNCGAKDCPPVTVYTAADINKQLDRNTAEYLQKHSSYNAETQTVKVTSLLNWFRGDFGCKKGIKKILKTQNIIPTTKNIKLQYSNYDWNLDLDNWSE